MLAQALGPRIVQDAELQEPASDELLVCNRSVQSRDEIAAGIAFYNVAAPTDPEGFLNHLGAGVLAQKNDF